MIFGPMGPLLGGTSFTVTGALLIPMQEQGDCSPLTL